ncbi:hypothetical protein ACFE04_016103 [Oxalis oulophora]
MREGLRSGNKFNNAFEKEKPLRRKKEAESIVKDEELVDGIDNVPYNIVVLKEECEGCDGDGNGNGSLGLRSGKKFNAFEKEKSLWGKGLCGTKEVQSKVKVEEFDSNQELVVHSGNVPDNNEEREGGGDDSLGEENGGLVKKGGRKRTRLVCEEGDDGDDSTVSKKVEEPAVSRVLRSRTRLVCKKDDGGGSTTETEGKKVEEPTVLRVLRSRTRLVCKKDDEGDSTTESKKVNEPTALRVLRSRTRLAGKEDDEGDSTTESKKVKEPTMLRVLRSRTRLAGKEDDEGDSTTESKKVKEPSMLRALRSRTRLVGKEDDEGDSTTESKKVKESTVLRVLRSRTRLVGNEDNEGDSTESEKVEESTLLRVLRSRTRLVCKEGDEGDSTAEIKKVEEPTVLRVLRSGSVMKIESKEKNGFGGKGRGSYNKGLQNNRVAEEKKSNGRVTDEKDCEQKLHTVIGEMERSESQQSDDVIDQSKGSVKNWVVEEIQIDQCNGMITDEKDCEQELQTATGETERSESQQCDDVIDESKGSVKNWIVEEKQTDQSNDMVTEEKDHEQETHPVTGEAERSESEQSDDIINQSEGSVMSRVVEEKRTDQSCGMVTEEKDHDQDLHPVIEETEWSNSQQSDDVIDQSKGSVKNWVVEENQIDQCNGMITDEKDCEQELQTVTGETERSESQQCDDVIDESKGSMKNRIFEEKQTGQSIGMVTEEKDHEQEMHPVTGEAEMSESGQSDVMINQSEGSMMSRVVEEKQTDQSCGMVTEEKDHEQDLHPVIGETEMIDSQQSDDVFYQSKISVKNLFAEEKQTDYSNGMMTEEKDRQQELHPVVGETERSESQQSDDVIDQSKVSTVKEQGKLLTAQTSNLNANVNEEVDLVQDKNLELCKIGVDGNVLEKETLDKESVLVRHEYCGRQPNCETGMNLECEEQRFPEAEENDKKEPVKLKKGSEIDLGQTNCETVVDVECQKHRFLKTEESDTKEQVKRKRGRPFKVKRKRGRPFKAKQSDGEVKLDQGRSFDYDSLPSGIDFVSKTPNATESDGKEHVKRKRGRPFKVKQSVEEVKLDQGRSFDRDSLPTGIDIVSSSPNATESGRKEMKRKRGRPRKLQDSDGDEIHKPGRPPKMNETLKRGRGRPPNGHNSNKGIIYHSDEKMRKVKRKRRGRPPKAKQIDNTYNTKLTTNDQFDAFHKIKKCLQMRRKLKQNVLKRNNSNLAILSKIKQIGERGIEKANDKSRRAIIRDRIVEILLNACWTIDYRPRRGKDYQDAVYCSPEGRTHWSVTKAYIKFLEHYENEHGKSNYTFAPILPEELSMLQKVITKRRKGNKKVHQEGCDEDIADEEVTQRRKKRKFNLLKAKDTRKIVVSGKGIAAKQRGTQKRKRYALLARNSVEDPVSQNGGYVHYDGKRTVLGWMIDMGTVPLNGKVLCINQSGRRVLEGKITKEGINCDCCNEIFTVPRFEIHAENNLGQPFQNIYLENGTSLLHCLMESWNKQESSKLKGFHFVDVDGEDPNDDTCGICGDGGDLICCDSCPSTFHQSCLNIKHLIFILPWLYMIIQFDNKFPSGDWHCVYCSCKFCAMVAGDSADSALLTCCLCEEKYHKSCVEAEDTLYDDHGSPSFCGKKCQEIFERLKMLLGVKHELEDGFSCTFVRRSDVDPDKSVGETPMKVESNSKLAVALLVMDECFLPLVDHRSGDNLIHNILYNFGSNFNRLNYSGFFTAILERNDEIISAASIRIHGTHLAEMPFIGTRYMYRRQGMCRRLLKGIESALGSLNIENLVIPAISQLMDTWTSVFGFKPADISMKRKMKKMNMLVFPGVDMLEKPILQHQPALVLAKGLNHIDLNEKVITTEVANNTDGKCPTGFDLNSQLPDTCDLTCEATNLKYLEDSNQASDKLASSQILSNTFCNDETSPSVLLGFNKKDGVCKDSEATNLKYLEDSDQASDKLASSQILSNTFCNDETSPSVLKGFNKKDGVCKDSAATNLKCLEDSNQASDKLASSQILSNTFCNDETSPSILKGFDKQDGICKDGTNFDPQASNDATCYVM